MSEQLYSSISRGSNQTQQEAYIFAEKFFQNNSSEFQERFERLIWITYCKQFKPLLIELDSWLGKPVVNLKTDNQWGCTIRCLQMLLANGLLLSQLEIPPRMGHPPVSDVELSIS